MRWERARRVRAVRAVLLGVVVCVAAGLPPAAGEAMPLGTYGGAVLATTVSFSGETNQFSGLPAVANVPYVTAVLESSPAGVATATVFDTGPLGQAGVATGNQYAYDYGAPEQMRMFQPQYATARHPGKPQEVSRSSVGGSDPSGTGGAEAATASAAAAADRVEARAEAAGVRMAAPEGSPSWGEQATPWVVRAATMSSAGGIVATATNVAFEATTFASGLEVLRGLIRIDSLRSVARATMGFDGPATESELVAGGVSIGGVPVVLTQNGPKVAEDEIPGGADGLRDARARLREALAPASVDVRVIDSERHESRSETGSLEARAIVGGIRITWVTPSPDVAIPTQHFSVILGGAEAGGHAELPKETESGPTTSLPGDETDSRTPAVTPAPPVYVNSEPPLPPADDKPVRVLGTWVGRKSPRSGGGLLALFGLWNILVGAVLVRARARGIAARGGAG